MKNKYKIELITFLVIILGLVVFSYCFKDKKVHTLKKYYPDSKETVTFEYVIRDDDTIIEGKSIRYNEKGNIMNELNFVNNTLKGEGIYYKNGVIESKVYFIDNNRKAEILWNYPNGEIEKYAFFSKYKEPIFLISYDKEGPTQYDGHVVEKIYHGKLNSNKQNNSQEEQYFKVGDTLIYQYLVANIPLAKRSFKIENIGIDNANVIRTTTPKPPTTIEVKEVLTKKGKNTIKAVVIYEFKDNIMPAIINTLSFEVEVH